VQRVSIDSGYLCGFLGKLGPEVSEIGFGAMGFIPGIYGPGIPREEAERRGGVDAQLNRAIESLRSGSLAQPVEDQI
jgi:hypothetical protein